MAAEERPFLCFYIYFSKNFFQDVFVLNLYSDNCRNFINFKNK